VRGSPPRPVGLESSSARPRRVVVAGAAESRPGAGAAAAGKRRAGAQAVVALLVVAFPARRVALEPARPFDYFPRIPRDSPAVPVLAATACYPDTRGDQLMGPVRKAACGRGSCCSRGGGRLQTS